MVEKAGEISGQPNLSGLELRQAQMIKAAHPDAAPGSMYYRDVPPIKRTYRPWHERTRDSWRRLPGYQQTGFKLFGGTIVAIACALYATRDYIFAPIK